MHTSLACAVAVFAILLSSAQTLPIEERQSRERRSNLGDLVAESPGVINTNYVQSLRNCKELSKEGHTKSGIYVIDPRDGGRPISVFCDMSLDVGGKKGWLAIQRRVDGTIEFNRTLSEYKYGFGQLDGSFWLGLKEIKRILDCGSNGYELYMGMGRHRSTSTKYANWDTFSIGTEANDWKLTISTTSAGFTASAGVTNSLAVSNGRKFSTKDRDNDASSGNCASTYKGGWWYNNCHEANPNGYYYPTSDNVADYNGVLYEGWLGKAYSLKTVVMLIRPK